VDSSHPVIYNPTSVAQQIAARQEQLRKNLSALGASEREGQLRNRLLDDLEVSEDRRRAIEAGLVELGQQAQQAQEDQWAILDELYGQAVS
jgi:serine phosphatase RsbU (regulator of sigma subunit)